MSRSKVSEDNLEAGVVNKLHKILKHIIKTRINGCIRYTCRTCQGLKMWYTTDRLYNMTRHYTRHHCELKTSRVCCENIFKTRGDYNKHIKISHGKTLRWFVENDNIAQRKSDRNEEEIREVPNCIKRCMKKIVKNETNERANRVCGQKRKCSKQESSMKGLKNLSLDESSAGTARTETKGRRELEEEPTVKEMELQAIEFLRQRKEITLNKELEKLANDFIRNFYIFPDGNILPSLSRTHEEISNESEFRSGIESPQDTENDNPLTELYNSNIDKRVTRRHNTFKKCRTVSRSRTKKINNKLKRPVVVTQGIQIKFDENISFEDMTREQRAFLNIDKLIFSDMA